MKFTCALVLLAASSANAFGKFGWEFQCAHNDLHFISLQCSHITHYFDPFSLKSIKSTAPVATTSRATALFAEDDGPSGGERGVSVDQDGKSNVWAIEPKMEVDTTSGEDKIKGYLAAGVGLVAFAGVAGFALNHLPDPNQF